MLHEASTDERHLDSPAAVKEILQSNVNYFTSMEKCLFPRKCFENSKILQSLLLFSSAYHLQSQIVYWISNIGLSGSQYAGGARKRGRRLENGAKCGGNEDWSQVDWEMRRGCWQDNLTVHRGDESCKNHLQFQVGQNNVMLSDGGKKYGWDRSALAGKGIRQPIEASTGWCHLKLYFHSANLNIRVVSF